MRISTIILCFILTGSYVYPQKIYEYHHGADGPDEIEYFFVRKPKGREAEDAPVNGVLCYSSFSGDRHRILRTLRSHSEMVNYAEGLSNSNYADPEQPDFNLLDFAKRNPSTLNLMDWADAHGLAAISWTRAEFGHNKVVNAEDQTSSQKYSAEKKLDPSLDSWKRAVPKLARRYNLPEEGYLMFGISGGAQWAHRFALREPQYFTAVHIAIGSSYDVPNSDGAGLLWLVSTGELEIGYSLAVQFYDECRKKGYNIIFKASENVGHTHTTEAKELSIAFFNYALHRQTLAQRNDTNPQDIFSDEFSRPAYYGDFLNQFVIPANKRDLIEDYFSVCLPTETLANAWGDIMP